jgi:hypothetical protein
MYLRKYQEGGAMPEEQGAPAEQGGAPEGGAPEQGGAPQGGGQDPLMQIAQIFAQGLQNQDCQALAQGAQMFLQLLQEATGGQGGQGGQPQGPVGQEPQGQPVFRKGGRIIGRTRY